MSVAPIVLHFYDPETFEVKKTFIQAFIRWKLVKKVAKWMKAGIDFENLDEESIEEINQLIVDIFGGRFTAEELEENTEFSEVVTALGSIFTMVRAMMPESNPTMQA